jgi:hypothetical protein
MEKITPEQQKEINKLGWPYFRKIFFNGLHHLAMLFMLVFILDMSIKILEWPRWSYWVCLIPLSIFVMNRRTKIDTKHFAKLCEDIKKITNK